MNNLEKLTKIITDKIPDILELKFGCIIEFNDKEWGDENKFGKICEHGEKFGKSYMVWSGLSRYVSIRKWHITKIIGRLITLVDVLRVSSKKDKYLTISDEGQLGYTDMFYKTIWTNKHWNLENDLNNQSQETIDFLLKILTKK